MKMITGSVLIGLAILMGFAHSTMRGTVAMKVSDNEAHICMGDKEVQPGDKSRKVFNAK